MPYEWQEEEDEEDFDADEYDPDDPETYPHGVYADPELASIACPHCGENILEESQQCPSCKMYISAEDAPKRPPSTAWLILIVLTLLAVIMMVLGRG